MKKTIYKSFIAGILLSIFVFTAASYASAQTGAAGDAPQLIEPPVAVNLQAEELQRKIADLKAQIAVLQAQLDAMLRGGNASDSGNIPATGNIAGGFSQALRFGSRGQAVSDLQSALAGDPTIYPAGLVTGFFGPLTEEAVKRFQAKNNIVSGGDANTTGFGMVGPKTNLWLNRIFGSSSGGDSSGKPVPYISGLQPTSGPIGTKVMIMGVGFTATGNDINFAGVNRAVTKLSSSDGKTLIFTVPATPCTPGQFCIAKVLDPGSYDVSVSNINGTSNTLNFTITPN